jgi:hypothetical protein
MGGLAVNLQTTGTLLVAAFMVFLAGAGFWLVREFEQPLAVRLCAVAAHQRRWMWIHAWMIAGTLMSLLAVSSLVRLLRDDGGGRWATVGWVLFAIGCFAMLASLIFGVTATPRAAMESLRTGVVPLAYQGRQRIASALYVSHMLLSYATFAALGCAMLRSSIVPVWLGWTGVASGTVGFTGFLVMRGGPFGPPIIAHAFGLLVGIVMLVGK